MSFGGSQNVAALVGSGVAFNPGGARFDWQKSIGPFTTAALTSSGGALPDSSFVTLSYWVRGTASRSTQSNSFRLVTSGFMSFISHYSSTAPNAELFPGINTTFDNRAGVYGTGRFNFVTPASAVQANTFVGPSNVPPPQSAEWTHILECIDLSVTGNAQKAYNIAIGGIPLNPGGVATIPGTLGALLVNISNPEGFFLANPSLAAMPNVNPSLIGTIEIAEPWIAFGTSIIDHTTSLFNPGIIAAFIDGSGNPVFLGPNGGAPLGNSVVSWYSSGPGSAIGTNKAIGSQAITNAMTQSGVFSSLFGPGPAVPHQCQYMGTYGEALPTATTTATTLADVGIKIRAGDLVEQTINILSTNSVDRNVTVPVGWLNIANIGPTSNTPSTARKVYKIAAVDDESVAITWTWTGNNGASHGGTWQTTVIRGCDIVAPIDAAVALNNNPVSDNVNFATAPIQPVVSNALFINSSYAFQTGQTFSNVAGEVRMYSSPSNSLAVFNAEQLTTNTLVAAKAFTCSSADAGPTFSVTYKPA